MNAHRAVVCCVAALLCACGNTPPAPDWQMNAKSSIERAQSAYLEGKSTVEAVEFARARTDVASTGRPDLLARLELARCATRVASLVFEECAGYAALAQDAAAPERAYAEYLAGNARAGDAALLPEQHRIVAAALASPTVAVTTATRATFAGANTVAVPSAPDLKGLSDPLSRLVASGVLLRTGRADPATITLAIDTASAQGWRRPLLAWLGVQVQRAEAAGDAQEAARIRRRIALAGEGPAKLP